jgi:hypothetical protein
MKALTRVSTVVGAGVALVVGLGALTSAAPTSGTATLVAGGTETVNASGCTLKVQSASAHQVKVHCGGAVSSTTTSQPTTTTSSPSGGPGTCTSPIFTTGEATGTINLDPHPQPEFWWVDNDAWSGSHGPQTIQVCSQQSWDAISNQTDQQGQVETYPNTEYDVNGREGQYPSTKPISGYNSITSTFAEGFPTYGNWDASYDLWLNNWSTEIMIWNQWAGAQGYWPGIATISLTLGGVGYKFYDNGGELMFFRDTQVASGSVDILAAFNWLVGKGYVNASDAPTQLEYGVEICATANAAGAQASETFPLTGVTFSVS